MSTPTATPTMSDYVYVLYMTSDEYGTETFSYNTRAEAEEGQQRIEAKVEALNDGIERWFRIAKERDPWADLFASKETRQ